MIIDANLRCSGQETADDVLRALDAAHVDMAVLSAPFQGLGSLLGTPAPIAHANAHLASLTQRHRDRLFGLAVVDPLQADATRALGHAVTELGLQGVRMLPTGWYPHQDEVQAVFGLACELDVPVLLHSGVCADGRTSRFSRPVFFEALRAHPGLRVALTNLGWPWTDEAIAIGMVDRANGLPANEALFRFDIPCGPPPAYRRESLSKALAVLGSELLQFGSGCTLPCKSGQVTERITLLKEMMDELELDAHARQRIWSGTASAWLGLETGEARGASRAMACPTEVP
jgi:predicted TIM-barrel fold metal-dependent hydrolase